MVLSVFLVQKWPQNCVKSAPGAFFPHRLVGCHEAWLSFAPSWRQSLLGFHLLGAWHHPTDATKCSARAATTEVWNWNWNDFMAFYIFFSPNCHPKNQELELLLSCFPPKFKITIFVIAPTTNWFTCSIFFPLDMPVLHQLPKFGHFTIISPCFYHVVTTRFPRDLHRPPRKSTPAASWTRPPRRMPCGTWPMWCWTTWSPGSCRMPGASNKTAVGEDWDGWLGWLGYPLVN